MRNSRIRQGFDRAVEYEAHAPVQRLVAMRLAKSLADHPVPAGGRILEIGCGTGFLSQRLGGIHPGARLYLSDLSPEMVKRCRRGLAGEACYFAMDGERLAVRGGFDLIVASLAMQWFGDFVSGTRGLLDLLSPGGRLTFATLGRDTFCEWREANEQEGVSPGIMELPDLNQVLSLYPGSRGREERVVTRYESGQAFLRQLKGAGASTARGDHRPLAPNLMRRVLSRVEADGEVAMTWHVLYIDIMKR